MKYCIFILMLIPMIGKAQVSSDKYYRSDSTVYCEIIQLDSLMDAHRQIVHYHKNGSKAREYFDNNRVIYDTLNEWNEEGVITYREIYSDTGYTQISYHSNGQISEIGAWVRVYQRSKEMTVRDSSTFEIYETAKCKDVCYERIGKWKSYYPNGHLKSQGSYLPMEFSVAIPTATDSSGVNHYPVSKTSFDFISPSGIYMGCSTFLPNGKWIFYLETGEIKEEVTYKDGLYH